MARTLKTQAREIEARWQEFWRDHEAYDSSWPRNVLHNLAEFMPFVFRFDAVGEGISVMYAESGVGLPEDFDWTSADEDLPANELRKLPIFRLALALRAYAYYGLLLKTDDEFDYHGLKRFLEDAMDMDGKTYRGFFPLQWALDDEMRQTITAALARRKLDHDHGEGLEPEELAALARVNRKTVMNLVAPSSGSGLRLDVKGKIPFEDARRWLVTRPDFRSSVSQQQHSRTPWSKSEGTLAGEPIFVPALEDGTWFSPVDSLVSAKSSRVRGREALADKRNYRVGDADFEDYWQALDTLHRMDMPRWRQPDTVGRAREKVGTRWVRKTREELEQLLNAAHQKAPGRTSRRTVK